MISKVESAIERRVWDCHLAQVKSLESDPELHHVFEDIKKNGMEAAMKYYQDH